MVGVLLSVNRWVRLLTNTLAGWAMARYGSRGPFVIAVFASALTTAAYAAGRGFWIFFLARTAWGLCFSFLRLGGYLAALEMGGAGRRGYYLGFFHGAMRFGSFIAVLTGGVLTDLLGFTATAFLFAGAGVVGGLAVLRERPPATLGQGGPTPAAAGALEGAANPTSKAQSAGSYIQAGAPAGPSVPEGPAPSRQVVASVSGLFRWGSVYTLAFIEAMLLSGLVTSTLGLWLSLQTGAEGTAGIGIATVTGAVLSTRFLFEVVGGPTAGSVSDRFGRLPVVLVALLLEAGALAGLASSSGLGGSAASALALFVFSAAHRIGVEATAGDLTSPQKRAVAMSWYATASDLGAAAGPLIGYWMAAAGRLAAAYAGGAGLLVAGGVLYVLAARRG